MKKLLLIVSVLTAAFTSCEKVEVNSMYHIVPYVQPEQNGNRLGNRDIEAYAFLVNEKVWEVEDYERALLGIIRHESTLQEIGYDFHANPDRDTVITFGPITRKLIFLVMCDTVNKHYAYRYADIGENLPSITIKMKFQPWRRAVEYIDSGWNIVNEFYDPDQDDDDDDDDEDEDEDEGDEDGQDDDDGEDGDQDNGESGGDR